MTGAIEKALEENKAKLEHLVDNEKTADAINDSFIQSVTSAAQPFLAQKTQDEEDWVICCRAQVTKLSKQRRDEREEANKGRGAIMKLENPEQKRRMNEGLTEEIRRLSINQNVAKKKHEKDRKRVFGEQLNDALRKGEAREPHRLSRMLAGRGMGARRRHHAETPATRQCSEE